MLSMHRNDNSEDRPNTYGACAELLDRVVSLYNISIVTAAGNTNNTSEGIISGGMGLNVITVGNFNRRTNSIDPSSNYNPTNTYLLKPDLCAPGYFLLTAHTCSNFNCTSEECRMGECSDSACNCGVLTQDSCCSHHSTYDVAGTSQATPLVAASIALLMRYEADLKQHPELVKAVLMAGVKTSGTTHYYIPGQGNYRQYGAGILDVWNAYLILKNQTYELVNLYTSGGDLNQYIPLQSNKKARICFAGVWETLESSISTTEYGYGYDTMQVSFSFFSSAGSSVGTIGNNNNVHLISHNVGFTDTYRVHIENSGFGPYTESNVYFLPCAFAWIQF